MCAGLTLSSMMSLANSLGDLQAEPQALLAFLSPLWSHSIYRLHNYLSEGKEEDVQRRRLAVRSSILSTSSCMYK